MKIYQVGDSDPLPPRTTGRLCQRVEPDHGYMCTLFDDDQHGAQHVAGNGTKVLAVWPVKELEPAALVSQEVIAERFQQDAKWGEQNHRDGTGSKFYQSMSRSYRIERKRADELGRVTWSLILLEEVFEALAESDPAKLRAELVQTAAVATAWVEAIDRRSQS